MTISSGIMALNSGQFKINPTAGISIVQSSFSGSTANNTDHSISFTAGTPVEGNILALFISADAVISSTTGATWTQVDAAVDFTGSYIYYRQAGAAEQISVGIKLGALGSCTMGLMEIGGVTTLDVHDPNTGQGSTTVTGGPTSTTTAANEMAIVMAGLSNGSSVPPPRVTSWTNGYTALSFVGSSGIGNPVGLSVGYQILSTAGVQSTVGTLISGGSSNNSTILATFK